MQIIPNVKKMVDVLSNHAIHFANNCLVGCTDDNTPCRCAIGELLSCAGISDEQLHHLPGTAYDPHTMVVTYTAFLMYKFYNVSPIQTNLIIGESDSYSMFTDNARQKRLIQFIQDRIAENVLQPEELENFKLYEAEGFSLSGEIIHKFPSENSNERP